MSKSSNRRKSAAIVLAVLGVAGLSLASAATLNLSGTGTLGANTVVVASCQPTQVASAITVGFATTFNLTNTTGYKVSSVVLKSVDVGCNGKAVKVTLLGVGDAFLGEVTGPAVTNVTTLSVPTTTVIAATDVVKVSVVISD